jgi:uncharacterized protein (TIGR02301 family)
MMTRLTAPVRTLLAAANLLAPTCLALSSLTPACLAQDTVDRRAALQQLSATLGEAHAIRSLCNGEDDQTWRNYMLELQNLEAPDGADKAQLTRAFNSGYKKQRGLHSECSPAMAGVEAEIAARGRSLAETMARSYLR